eukprot:6327429-Pyramimonas_sp.AAC.1
MGHDCIVRLCKRHQPLQPVAYTMVLGARLGRVALVPLIPTLQQLPGAFEVTLEDGTVLYSTLLAKKLPSTRDLLNAVENVRLEGPVSSGGGCS